MLYGQPVPPPKRQPADVTAARPTATPGLDYDELLNSADRALAGGTPQESIDSTISRLTGGQVTSHDQLRTHPSSIANAALTGASFGAWPRVAGAFAAMANRGGYAKGKTAAEQAPWRAAHPGLDAAIEISSGLATGLLGGELGGVTEAQSLLGAGTKGAAVGAAGGAFGAAMAEPDLTHPDIGRIARGAVLPTLLAGGAGMAGYEASKLSPAWLAKSRLRHALSPEESPGLLENEALFNRTGRGNIRTLSDLSPALQGEGDFAATADPETKLKYKAQFAARANDQAARLQEDLRKLYGAEPNKIAYGGKLREMALSIENDPQTGYDAVARNAGPISDPRIEPLLARPGVRSAANAAFADLATGGATPAATDPKALFYLYRRLRGAAGAAFRSGDTDAASNLVRAHGELRDILSEHVPEFGALNARLSPVLGSEAALEDAPNFFTKVDRQALAAKIGAMRPQELAAYREGTANALREALDAASTNANLAAKLDQAGPSLKAKMRLIFGDKDKFNQFMDASHAEFVMRQRGGMFAGSETAPREQAIQTPKVRLTSTHGLLEGLHARLFENLPLFNTRNMARKAGMAEAPHLFTPGASVAGVRKAIGQRSWWDRLQTAGPAATTAATRGLLEPDQQ